VESGVIVDQLQESVFSGCAGGTEVCDIDDKFTAIKMLFGLCILAKEFGDPRLNENALDHHSALPSTLSDRDLQHATLFRERPRVQPARQNFAAVTTLIWRTALKSRRNEVEGVNFMIFDTARAGRGSDHAA
jgi:hypothetical protein